MKKIKILIIEDNSIDKRLMEEFLSDLDDLQFDISHAFRLKEAFNLLNLQDYDIVTLDLGLPDSHGLETFERFQAAFPNIPTIVVSGYEDPHVAKTVVTAGAHGYIVKGNFDQQSLVKEIKLAINKQGFRAKVAEKIFIGASKIEPIIKSSSNEDNVDSKQISKKTLEIAKNLSEREPEIFQELVTEYLQLIPLSADINSSQIKVKVKEFFEKHNEAFMMLNLSKEDVAEVHEAALSKLTFVDKNNSNFKSLTAILIQEATNTLSCVNIIK